MIYKIVILNSFVYSYFSLNLFVLFCLFNLECSILSIITAISSTSSKLNNSIEATLNVPLYKLFNLSLKLFNIKFSYFRKRIFHSI